MNIENVIEKYELNDSEAAVLRLMDAQKETLRELGIREVAKQSFVSPGSIINMSKKIGFSGYSELVFAIASVHDQGTGTVSLSVEEYQEPFSALLSRYKEKKIMVHGFGFSQNLANFFSEYLNLYGFRATANSHLELLRKTDDEILIIIISNSGNTKRLLELSQIANDRNLDLIAFVGMRDSKIGQLATLTISTETYNPSAFQEFYPNLFFGTALNQFELLMSHTLKNIFM